ncbi:hypothetical protein B0H13DRAFT_1892636 [Mycena leptocephala]|nr:hypothetical protein B0H13DRAFT_1892636 [Mycena leptocephala]
MHFAKWLKLWEDYTFMILWQENWHTAAAEVTKGQSNNSRNILWTASPQLIRILYAHRVFPDTRGRLILFRIHFLLDLSWYQLREAISPLRGILGDNLPRLEKLLTSDLDETFLGSVDLKSLLLELAVDGLRVIGGSNYAAHSVWESEGDSDSDSDSESEGDSDWTVE